MLLFSHMIFLWMFDTCEYAVHSNPYFKKAVAAFKYVVTVMKHFLYSVQP